MARISKLEFSGSRRIMVNRAQTVPSKPPGKRGWRESERDREAGSSCKSQLSTDQKSKETIQRSEGPTNSADDRS